MKLKELKVAVEAHSESMFSNFSCRREALLFLKRKVRVFFFIWQRLCALSLFRYGVIREHLL